MQIQTNNKGIIGIAGALLISVSAIIFGVRQETAVNLPVKHIIIEAGHGGEENDQYLTSGKRSPIWPDGTQILEGTQNRYFAHWLALSLYEADVEFTFINGYNQDYSLQKRCELINAEYDRLKALNPNMHIIAISLHSNAQDAKNGDYKDSTGLKGFTSEKTGGAVGIETFTSTGWTESDNFNENYLYPELQRLLPEFKFRLGNKQKGKEANFYILRNTKCPIVLIEYGFMTTWTDCKLMRNKDVGSRYIKSITNAVLNYKPKNLQK